jgi:hypothetical protein
MIDSDGHEGRTDMRHVPDAHRSPKAPPDRAWDWGEDVSGNLDDLLEHGGWHAVAKAHAWYDPSEDPDHDPPQQKGAYKLPHHEVIDGRLRVVRRGVMAAMTVINGARSGVDLPTADRRAVYEHLAAHYRQFGDEPPELAGGG